MTAHVIKSLSPPRHSPKRSKSRGSKPSSMICVSSVPGKSVLLAPLDSPPFLCCPQCCPQHCYVHTGQLRAFPQRCSRMEGGRSPDSGDRRGFWIPFCQNYRCGLYLMSAWSSFPSVSIRFVLILPYSSGGSSGTRSAPSICEPDDSLSLCRVTGHREK